MTYFDIKLSGAGTTRELGALPFTSLGALIRDAEADLPDLIADLIRNGDDPLEYVYQFFDEDAQLVGEIQLSSKFPSACAHRSL